jgi:hypothetical protein
LKNYLEMKQLKRSIKTVKNKVMIKIWFQKKIYINIYIIKKCVL